MVFCYSGPRIWVKEERMQLPHGFGACHVSWLPKPIPWNKLVIYKYPTGSAALENCHTLGVMNSIMASSLRTAVGVSEEMEAKAFASYKEQPKSAGRSSSYHGDYLPPFPLVFTVVLAIVGIKQGMSLQVHCCGHTLEGPSSPQSQEGSLPAVPKRPWLGTWWISLCPLWNRNFHLSFLITRSDQIEPHPARSCWP